MTDRTFTIIKPDAVAAGQAGKILDAVIADGFRIVALRLTRLDRGQAERFYAVHRGKPFFERLVEFMTSGPVLVGVLERENAVAEFRRLIGATDPAKAGEGTIRRHFGTSAERNAVHGADSDANARLEWAQFFTEADIRRTEGVKREPARAELEPGGALAGPRNNRDQTARSDDRGRSGWSGNRDQAG